jgi:hypothetical protein
MSDATSIAMPRVYVPRDASVCAAASDAPVVLVWFVVVVVVAGRAGPARGRESVAMTTPDETTARAIFARERTKRRECRQHASAGPVPLGGEREEGSEGMYYLLERVSLVHEYATDEHGHAQSCTPSPH